MLTPDSSRPRYAPYGFTCVRWSPSRMRRPDHHNEIELNLLQSGWVTYLFGGHKIEVRAGQLSAFWAAIPHQILDFGDEPDYFVATVPFAWFLGRGLPEKLVRPMLEGEIVQEPDTRRAPFDDELFSNWFRDLKHPADEITHVLLLELEARLIRLGLALPGKKAARPRPKARRGTARDDELNKVEQMACFIARRYLERLTVDDIGKAVGLHPNYAMGLFQRTFGTTLVEHLTHHRVSHAQRLLATTESKIVEIAFDSGFSSISRFNEAFRRSCGCSPREYRKLHRLAN